MSKVTAPAHGETSKGLPWTRTALWALAGAATWGALRWAGNHPEWVERYYSRGVYPYIRGGLAWLSGLASASLAEAGALLLLGLCGLYVAWALWRVVRGRAKLWSSLLGGVLRGVRLCALVYMGFAFCWGLNHGRLPLAASAGLTPVEDKAPVLESLARGLVRSLIEDQYVGQIPDGFAVFANDGSPDRRVGLALEKLAVSYPSLAGELPNLRRLRFWGTFAKLGISGIFIPFTGEPHFNGGVPACRHPFVAFHEISHQRGFAREDEANFLGWLLCQGSDDAHYRYAGNLAALSKVMSALRRHDGDLVKTLMGELPESVHADLRAVRAFWKAYESPARNISLKVNDTYLKSQGQSHGVRSYGRMVELMLSHHAQGR